MLVLCTAATQRVKIFVNDKYIGTEVAGEAFECHIPESEKGLVKIRFEYPDAVSPQKLGMNEDETMLALRIFSIRFFRSE